MLTKDEFEILFASWKRKYGVEKTSKLGTVYYGVPSNSNDRQTMLRYLINTLVTTNGYQESDFGNYLKNMIVEQCVNPQSPDKARLKGWRAASYEDVNAIIAEVFEKDFVETAKPNKPKRLQEALDRTDELPPEYFGPNDEEEVTITKPLDDSMFNGIPDIHYPRLTHEEFLAKLEKEIEDRELENGDE